MVLIVGFKLHSIIISAERKHKIQSKRNDITLHKL